MFFKFVGLAWQLRVLFLLYVAMTFSVSVNSTHNIKEPHMHTWRVWALTASLAGVQ